MPPIQGASTSPALAQSALQQLAAIDATPQQRVLTLRSPRTGPLDVVHHVQGLARVDCGDHAILVCSVSGKGRGSLWFARFDRVPDASRLGRRQLAKHGSSVAELSTETPHPGGIQSAGTLLAVASEDGGHWAQVDIYDLTNPERPFLKDTLPLDNSQGGGVSQLTKSRACWSAFTRLGADDYLLFVGGRDNAEQEGWFYRYTPRAFKKWTFEGNFAGVPVSSVNPAWGPHNGAAFVQTAADSEPHLIGFGSKGNSNGDEYQPRLRCFSVERPSSARAPEGALRPTGSARLHHLPPAAPRTFELDRAKFGTLGINPRWGTTAFVEDDGRLCLYVSERNAEPPSPGQAHELQIMELSAH